MSLGQCVVQWEGAFGVLVSGGGIQCTVQCVWEQSMRCSVYMGAIQCTVQWGGAFSVCGGAFSVMLTGLILCNLQLATVTMGS